MAITTRVSGTWRNVTNVYVRVSGVWRNVVQAFVKVSGNWVPLLQALFPTFDFSTATYNGDVRPAPEDDRMHSIAFHPDGNSFYSVSVGDGTIAKDVFLKRHFLSIKNDVSSVVSTETSQDITVSTGTGYMRGFFFNDDGTQVSFPHLFPNLSAAEVWVFDLSTAWDVTTMTYNGVYSNNIGGIDLSQLKFIDESGLDFIALDILSNGAIKHGTTPTPFDVSNATMQSTFEFKAATGLDLSDALMSRDGTRLLVVSQIVEDGNGDYQCSIYEYSLSTPKDLTTVTQESVKSIGSFYQTELIISGPSTVSIAITSDYDVVMSSAKGSSNSVYYSAVLSYTL